MAAAAAQPARAEPQVQCHIPSGQLITTTRDACREKIGLILPDSTPAAAQKVRTGDPTKSGARVVGAGSGFFVSDTGLVITAEHVVRGCDAVAVDSKDNSPSWARVLARDPATDLALIESSLKPAAVAKVRAAPDARTGEDMFTIALPSISARFGYKLNSARVTWVPRSGDLGMLAFGGIVKPGMSGGPLLDSRGQVAGVVFAASGPTAKEGEAAPSGPDKPEQYEQYDYGEAVQGAVLRRFLQQHKVPFTATGGSPVVGGEEAMRKLAVAMAVAVYCTVDP